MKILDRQYKLVEKSQALAKKVTSAKKDEQKISIVNTAILQYVSRVHY